MGRFFILFWVVFTAATAFGQEFRTWVDSTGKHTVTARLMEVKKEDSLIIIQKENSEKLIPLKIKDLSKTDQKWVREYLQELKKNALPAKFDFAGLSFVLIPADPPFYMSIYETTFGNFSAFVRSSKYKTTAEQARNNKTWVNPGFRQSFKNPVVFVSWNDINAYVAWLNSFPDDKRPKGIFTLPTVNQWVYAARGGCVGNVYWEGGFQKAGGYCNFRDKSVKGNRKWESQFEDGFEFTAPVGSYKPNAYGLYDVIGNVEEYTIEKITKGGHYYSGYNVCNLNFGKGQKPDTASPFQGFRVCFVPVAPKGKEQ